MKLTKRKGFNFFRSYYDVYNELETDKDKVAFIDALLDRQFLGVKPSNLKGMVKFAYVSQVNSIDTQVKGYEDRMKALNKKTENYDPWQGVEKVFITPPQQEKEKEKGKEEEKKNVDSNESLFNIFWNKYPKKVAKDKCKAKFLKLKQIEMEKILSTVDSFIKYKPFETYTHPNPETYLNQKRWEDEIPKQEEKYKSNEDIYYENVMRKIEQNKRP